MQGHADANHQPSFWKGAVAGAIGGLVASWAMNQFQSGPGRARKASSAASEEVFEHRLTKPEKRLADPAVHCLFGSMIGAAYGMLVEAAPSAARASGMPLGTALWLGADEIAVPTSAFASHAVYGLVADLVRRLVRAVL